MAADAVADLRLAAKLLGLIQSDVVGECGDLGRLEVFRVCSYNGEDTSGCKEDSRFHSVLGLGVMGDIFRGVFLEFSKSWW